MLLLATPRVLDPFFHRSVVLLLQHGDEGSLGFIINRTTGIRVEEVLDGLEIPWHGDVDAAAFFGGPVQPQLGTVLFHPAEDEGGDLERDTAVELVPGLLMTQHVGSLALLAAKPPGFFRLVLGYAGWGEGQLMEEIARNDWLVTEPSSELLYETPPDAVWERALIGMGIEPDALAVWDEAGSSVN